MTTTCTVLRSATTGMPVYICTKESNNLSKVHNYIQAHECYFGYLVPGTLSSMSPANMHLMVWYDNSYWLLPCLSINNCIGSPAPLPGSVLTFWHMKDYVANILASYVRVGLLEKMRFL